LPLAQGLRDTSAVSLRTGPPYAGNLRKRRRGVGGKKGKRSIRQYKERWTMLAQSLSFAKQKQVPKHCQAASIQVTGPFDR